MQSKVASLTEDTELHQMKESEKELLEPHAKTLSGLKQVIADKIYKDDNRMSLSKYKRSPWNTAKE